MVSLWFPLKAKKGFPNHQAIFRGPSALEDKHKGHKKGGFHVYVEAGDGSEGGELVFRGAEGNQNDHLLEDMAVGQKSGIPKMEPW